MAKLLVLRFRALPTLLAVEEGGSSRLKRGVRPHNNVHEMERLKLLEHIRRRFTSKTTEEILDIWTKKELSPETIQVAKELLLERGIALPSEHNTEHVQECQTDERTQAHDIKITPTEDGMIMVIPTRKTVKEWLCDRMGNAMIFLGMMLLWRVPKEFRVIAFLWYVVVFFMSHIGARQLTRLFGNTKIRLTQELLSIPGVFGCKWGEKHYSLASLNNVRFLSDQEMEGDVICEDGTTTIRLCHKIDSVNAHMFCKTLNEIVKYHHYILEKSPLPVLVDVHYAVIERIIFGTVPFREYNPYTLICNPNVSALHLPFLQLKQIIIHTETYDFYQVEQFLTYAINYIGQAYLKGTVEVHIYGNPEKLHANLRNNLTNLCQCVYMHEGNEMCVSSTP